ncbi:MAG: WYL domain-containing protein [Streptosporangiales bacterium]|nr:WYL domain-containing protein [Streptosporangiales bacterium]
MLRLLSLLQTHRYWPGEDLAERLGVSGRTLRRDVDRLRDLGYQVDASRGVAGGYQLRAGSALPPLLLDDDEAVAIALGLHTAAAASVAGAEDTSVRALTKVIQVMPPRLRRRVDALQAHTVPVLFPGPTVDAGSLTVIAQACRDAERIRFDYTKRDGDSASRSVEPHWLVSYGRRWYLVAYDVDRQDWRSFRIDRLVGPTPTGARFRPRSLPGDVDAASYVRAGIARAPTRYQVTVDVAAPAADVEKVVDRWGTVEPHNERSCRLQMNVDTLDWPALVLAAVNAEFEVVGPTELRDYLRGVGELFTRAAS